MTGATQEAEFVVRMTLHGMTYMLRIAGESSSHAVAMLQAIKNQPDDSPGKKSLKKMLKSKEPLRIFTVKEEQLKDFAKESKRYGIQYCIAKRDLDDIKNETYDILVRDSDAVRLNRIIEKLEMAKVEANISTDVNNAKNVLELSEAQKLIKDMFSPNKSERTEEERQQDTGALEPSETHLSEGSFSDINNTVSIKEMLMEGKVESESIRDVFSRARDLRELPEQLEIDNDFMEGWSRPSIVRDAGGEQLYRGKKSTELSKKDKLQILVDENMMLNGKLSDDLIKNLYKEGYAVDKNGIVESLKSRLTSRERNLIMDMMEGADDVMKDINHIKEAMSNG